MPKIVEISVDQRYFEHIVSGQKTIEGRINKGKFSDLQIGDCLFINQSIFKIVKDIKKFESFQQMLCSCGIVNIVPDAENITDAIAIYHQFYTPQQELEFGVLGIFI